MAEENKITAHIFGRSRHGDREEANLVLFNADGTEFVPGAKLAPPEPWVTIPDSQMLNGWSTRGPGYEVKYRKRVGNVVEFQGGMKKASLGKGQMFRMPEGYHPTTAGIDGLIFVVAAGPDGDGASISFQNDGWVVMYTNFDPTKKQWIQLGNVRYSVD
jgi:hypothetical protein